MASTAATPKASRWWQSPEPLDPSARLAVRGLMLAAAAVGYFGILMVQTITYAARSFGAGVSGQGYALASVRVDFFIALLIVSFADRLGRHRVLLACMVGAAVATAATGLTTSLAWYTGTQVGAKGLVSAAVVLIGIIAAEVAPKGARAYVVGLMTLAGSAGAGVCVLLLSTADAGPNAWRWLYIGALVTLPLVWLVARWVPEPPRFVHRNTAVKIRGYWKPLLMLSAGAVLLTVFSTPTIELKNDWLREARGYSGTDLTLYNAVAYGPGLFGVLLGGRLADRFGRRKVAIVGVVVAVFGGVASYWSHGWLVVAWSMLSGTFAGLAVAPLAVYRPELFPTALRARANGLIGGASRVGAATGLVLAASLSNDVLDLHRAIALLAVGPLFLVLLIALVYPETSNKSLEELHPSDADPPTK